MFWASNAISVCRIWRIDEPTILRMRVQDRGQAHAAFASRDMGQVDKPDLLRGLRCEVTGKPVGRNRIALTAVGRPGPARQGRQNSKIRTAHQPLDATASNEASMTAKDACNRGVPSVPLLSAWIGRMSSSSMGLAAPRWLSGRKRQAVVAAGGYAQDCAHQPNRPDLAVFIDESELHREHAPKIRAAPCRMSRSIRSHSFPAGAERSPRPGQTAMGPAPVCWGATPPSSPAPQTAWSIVAAMHRECPTRQHPRKPRGHPKPPRLPLRV
jgi:hypothetical protein